MTKFIGEIVSKSSNFKYQVKWDADEKTVWIDRKSFSCDECISEICMTKEEALYRAQKFIDGQPCIY
jgi:hypothetical protein